MALDVVGMEPNPGVLAAVEQGVIAAAESPEDKERERTEQNQVEAILKEYKQARDMDKTARAQYAIDRRYAAGTAHLNWAVSANLIGSFIDILVSFLYARNPDVSVKKPKQVDNRGTKQQDDFAKTLECVISSLWRAPTSTLKQAAQKMVRSSLSTGPGWLKAIIICKGTNIPLMQTQLNDSRQNIAMLEKCKAQLLEGDPAYGGEYSTPEEIDAKLLEIQELEASLTVKLEVAMRKAMVFDFVSSEDIQCSLDVRDLADYKSCGWIANAIYRTEADTLSLFPDLKKEDLTSATKYYQRATRDLAAIEENTYVAITGLAPASAESDVFAAEAEMYTSATMPTGVGLADTAAPCFYKIIERWNRITNHVETVIEGVKKFAKKPYQPDYSSTRFYPYFMLQFYPVDGARHPQSLPWRLRKLMDEYDAARSTKRLTRERSIPGVLFLDGEVDSENMNAVKNGTTAAFIGIKPVRPDAKIGDLFAPKPVANIDMRMYDTADVIMDMERVSGVQEALQSSVSVEKTATEAEIQQTGFASRTTSDRDQLETVLTDLAVYTGELALGALSTKDAQRICGPGALWPEGMAVDDLLTMVEIEIKAGTTGKPSKAQDRDSWGVILPIVTTMMKEIQAATLTGNLPLAEALSNLLRESMTRMDDEIDPEQFIPQIPEVPALPGDPGMGGGDPAMGNAMPGGDPNAPISDSIGPQLDAPLLEAPEIQPPAV
jgi:hypothetical protein